MLPRKWTEIRLRSSMKSCRQNSYADKLQTKTPITPVKSRIIGVFSLVYTYRKLCAVCKYMSMKSYFLIYRLYHGIFFSAATVVGSECPVKSVVSSGKVNISFTMFFSKVSSLPPGMSVRP